MSLLYRTDSPVRWIVTPHARSNTGAKSPVAMIAVEMTTRLRSTAPDGRVPLQGRISPPVLECLQDEAFRRRQSPSQLLEQLLKEELPKLAADRVHRQLAKVRLLRSVPENDETPGAQSRGSCSTSPQIFASASIAPRRPSGKPRGDASD